MDDLASWIADVTDGGPVEIHRRPAAVATRRGTSRSPGRTRTRDGLFLRADADVPGPRRVLHALARSRDLRGAGVRRPPGAADPRGASRAPRGADRLRARHGPLHRPRARRERAILNDLVASLVAMHGLDVSTLALPSLLPARESPITCATSSTSGRDAWTRAAGPSRSCERASDGCAPTTPRSTDRRRSCRGTPGPGTSSTTASGSPRWSTSSSPTSATRWRTWRGSGRATCRNPSPTSTRCSRRYALAGGHVDVERIRYHLVLAELRIAGSRIERADQAPAPDADVGSGLIYGTLHTRLTVEALAAATGTALLDAPPDDTQDSAATPYFDALSTSCARSSSRPSTTRSPPSAARARHAS